MEVIVIDFDIKDENGNKCFEKNLAEVSKGGNGIHLHYIYTGEDVTKLSRVYDVKKDGERLSDILEQMKVLK